MRVGDLGVFRLFFWISELDLLVFLDFQYSMWEYDVEGLGWGGNRLRLGVLVQGTPEGGSACMGKCGGTCGVYIGGCVGRWVGRGAGRWAGWDFLAG